MSRLIVLLMVIGLGALLLGLGSIAEVAVLCLKVLLMWGLVCVFSGFNRV